MRADTPGSANARLLRTAGGVVGWKATATGGSGACVPGTAMTWASKQGAGTSQVLVAMEA